MNKRVVASICLAAVALCATANARETKLNKKDRGLANVIERECKNILWTSEAMRMTGLDSSQLTLLKVGDVIKIPDNCRTTTPPKEVRLATLRILKHERIFFQARKTKETIAEITSERDAARQKVNKLQQQNNDLVLAANAKRAVPVPLPKTKRGNPIALIAIGGATGAMIAFLVFWFLTRLLRKNNHSLLEKISSLEEELRFSNEKQKELRLKLVDLLSKQVRASSIKYYGKTIEFKDTSEHWVGCPYCSEKRIKPLPQNMHGHLDKAHVSLRVQYITPEEMVRKLMASVG